MLLFHNFSISLTILFIIGVCPFAMNNKKCFVTWQSITYQTINIIVNVIVAISNCHWALTSINSVNVDSEFWNALYNSGISKYADQMYILLTVIVYCVILIELNKQRRNHVKFINNFCQFSDNLALITKWSNESYYYIDKNLFQWILAVILCQSLTFTCFRLFTYNFEAYYNLDVFNINLNTSILFIQLTVVLMTFVYMRHLVLLLLNRLIQIKLAFDNLMKNDQYNLKMLSQILLVLENFQQLKSQFSQSFNLPFLAGTLFDFVSITVTTFLTIINCRARTISIYDIIWILMYVLIPVAKCFLSVNIYDEIGQQVIK